VTLTLSPFLLAEAGILLNGRPSYFLPAKIEPIYLANLLKGLTTTAVAINVVMSICSLNNIYCIKHLDHI
jgi:hypothetical protein